MTGLRRCLSLIAAVSLASATVKAQAASNATTASSSAPSTAAYWSPTASAASPTYTANGSDPSATFAFSDYSYSYPAQSNTYAATLTVVTQSSSTTVRRPETTYPVNVASTPDHSALLWSSKLANNSESYKFSGFLPRTSWQANPLPEGLISPPIDSYYSSTQLDAHIGFAFNGEALAVLDYRGPNRGIFNITIDSVTTVIDGFSAVDELSDVSGTQLPPVIWTSSKLSNGRHQVTIANMRDQRLSNPELQFWAVMVNPDNYLNPASSSSSGGMQPAIRGAIISASVVTVFFLAIGALIYLRLKKRRERELKLRGDRTYIDSRSSIDSWSSRNRFFVGSGSGTGTGTGADSETYQSLMTGYQPTIASYPTYRANSSGIVISTTPHSTVFSTASSSASPITPSRPNGAAWTPSAGMHSNPFVDPMPSTPALARDLPPAAPHRPAAPSLSDLIQDSTPDSSLLRPLVTVEEDAGSIRVPSEFGDDDDWAQVETTLPPPYEPRIMGREF